MGQYKETLAEMDGYDKHLNLHWELSHLPEPPNKEEEQKKFNELYYHSIETMGGRLAVCSPKPIFEYYWSKIEAYEKQLKTLKKLSGVPEE
jgi:hypothetical protein